ncbi:hypothetical protein C2845_PM16G05110 [Panicum miliaceum]|uniref:Protein XRI1 n=1 Tax=Panicum miliaceum TaxID=4540 RepID=A0A3L6PWW2_PANMI|nr:hypothetical protein C2845_PM16G05110 [Panicum miliaceum]
MGRVRAHGGTGIGARVMLVVLPIGESRDWQAGEHSEADDASHADATKFVWDCLNQDDDELLGFLGNQTPLRDCRDFFADIPDISCKETLDQEESREAKRRHTISSLSNQASYWQEDNHLEHCSYGTPVPCTQESVAYVDDQAGISGSSEIAPVTESFIMQETRKLSTLKVSKGGSSSLVKAKQNITTTVAYPFTLIKPSWKEGDVTLQDINQRLRAPPKKPPEILGTSAFSGKPVIGKTRIKTDGGKGSITILRTKG